MGCAEIISFEEVRARQPWSTLRQQLHMRFDQWLDAVEERLLEPEPTLAEVTETIWALRQQLTGGLTETMIQHIHQGEQRRQHARCPTCEHLLKARTPVHRSVETMVGAVECARPYFYCRLCGRGLYPLDDALGLSAGRLQRDVQQAAATLVTEVPYATAAALFRDLSGIALSSERRHTMTNQAAEGLTVLDVAPSREEIERRGAIVAAHRFRRPVLVLGIDGAYVPTRPASARGRCPGQGRSRAKRAWWHGPWTRGEGLSLLPPRWGSHRPCAQLASSAK